MFGTEQEALFVCPEGVFSNSSVSCRFQLYIKGLTFCVNIKNNGNIVIIDKMQGIKPVKMPFNFAIMTKNMLIG